MDLQKGLPLTILAVVSVLAVVGLFLMYNADATGMVARNNFRTYGRAILTEAPKTAYQVNAWGQAIKAVKPSNPCFILGIQGDIYEPKDVPVYLTVEQYNNLNVCYPYFDIYDTNTDKVCCVL
jgi:hypothetical protein